MIWNIFVSQFDVLVDKVEEKVRFPSFDELKFSSSHLSNVDLSFGFIDASRLRHSCWKDNIRHFFHAELKEKSLPMSFGLPERNAIDVHDQRRSPPSTPSDSTILKRPTRKSKVKRLTQRLKSKANETSKSNLHRRSYPTRSHQNPNYYSSIYKLPSKDKRFRDEKKTSVSDSIRFDHSYWTDASILGPDDIEWKQQ